MMAAAALRAITPPRLSATWPPPQTPPLPVVGTVLRTPSGPNVMGIIAAAPAPAPAPAPTAEDLFFGASTAFAASASAQQPPRAVEAVVTRLSDAEFEVEARRRGFRLVRDQ